MANPNQPQENPNKKEGTRIKQAKEFYDEAGKAFENNDFEKSIVLYTKSIDADPNYASAYFNRALSYAILSKYKEATRDAEKVLALEPESYDAPYVMGIIAEYQQDYSGAKEWYELSIKRKPDYEQAKIRLEQLQKKLIEQNSSASPKTSMSSYESSASEKTTPEIQTNSTEVSEGQIKKVRWHKSKITFKDVVGMKKEKKLIYENVILAIRKPELLRVYGKRLGLGVIFYGPPGCGKTYFVNAIGGETNSNVIIAGINAALSHISSMSACEKPIVARASLPKFIRDSGIFLEL